MGAPVKPQHQLKKFRGYFYMTPDLKARLMAESARRGGASVSDIVRWALLKELPQVAVTVQADQKPDNLADFDSS